MDFQPLAAAGGLRQTLINARDSFRKLVDGSQDEFAGMTLSETLRGLAQKESAWEYLDQTELAAVGPLLLSGEGLLELAQRQSHISDAAIAACRRFALECCAVLLQHHGQNDGVCALLRQRSRVLFQACMHAFKNDANNAVRAAALQLLLRAVETPGCPPPQASMGEELLRELKVKYSKLTASIQANLLRVLAALADYEAAFDSEGVAAPEAPWVAELPRRLYGQLKRETDSAKPTMELLAGVFDALDKFLRRHAARFDEEELLEIYRRVSVVGLSSDAGVTRLGPQKSALRLLGKHATLFRRFYASEALRASSGTAAIKPSDAGLVGGVPACGGVLGDLLRVACGTQVDLAKASRDTLDCVLRALSEDVLGGDALGGDASRSAASSAGTRKRGPDGVEMDVEVVGASSESRDAAVVRSYGELFRAMVARVQTLGTRGVSLQREVLIGARSLGSLAPAIARLDGAAVVLDYVDLVLDTLDIAAGDVAEDSGVASLGGGAAIAVAEYVEALARMVPAVRPWLTAAQWARINQAGAFLLNSFGGAMTKHQPVFARAFVSLVQALREGGVAGTPTEAEGVEVEELEKLMEMGVIRTVTDRPVLRIFWEMVLFQCERTQDARTAVGANAAGAARDGNLQQRVVDGIMGAALRLAEHGVDNYLRLQRKEERACKQLFSSHAKARSSLMTVGTAGASLQSFSQDFMSAVVAEADPTSAAQAEFLKEQATEHAKFLQNMADLLDLLFGATAPPTRVQLLQPWVEKLVFAVEDLVALCRFIGSPPPGVFRLLRLALVTLGTTQPGGDRAAASLGQDLRRRLPSFLEEVASAVEGYEGCVADEAVEALLAVRPDWVNASRWLPVFRRALQDGLHDPGLAQHALRELERWRDAAVPVDWSLILPSLAAHIQVSARGETKAGTSSGVVRAAERRARLARRDAPGRKLEDQQAFLHRLLRFVGSLGGDCHALVTKEPPSDELQRPAAALSLRVQLALGGAAVELEPSLLFPHLARLLRPGVARAVRVAAGETLHALTRYVIGIDSVQTADASASSGREAPTEYAEALKSPVLPLAIRAAADDEPLLSKLFCPLLDQYIKWLASNDPTESLTALRDALLQANCDPHSPSLRSRAARFYSELMVKHDRRAGGMGAKVSKQLLQHLLAAVSHVDKCKQSGALQALSWCCFFWEAERDGGDLETRAAEAAAESLRTVVMCLQTSHHASDSRGAIESLALQVGSRLLNILARAQEPRKGEGAGSLVAVVMPGLLLLQLWRGVGSPEPAARGFCREALLRLRMPGTVAAGQPIDVVAAISHPWRESVDAWGRLQLRGPSGPPEAGVASCALELIVAQVDTALWLAMPDCGRSLLGLGVDPASLTQVDPWELSCRAAEEPSLLVPWRALGAAGTSSATCTSLDDEVLSEVLGHYRPRDRERVALARLRAFAAVVAGVLLGSRVPGPRTLDVLLTLVLAPAALQLQAAGSLPLASGAVAALKRIQTCAPGSLEAAAAAWLKTHPEYDFVASAAATAVTVAAAGLTLNAFEAVCQRWPEARRGDALGASRRMAAFAEGLARFADAASQGGQSSALWRLFFDAWPGGFRAMLAEWTLAIGRLNVRERRRSAAAQLMTQALVRFLVVIAPLPSAGAGLASTAPAGASAGAVLEALLCLPRPPQEALPHLLLFFAGHARELLELSRPWAPSRKRVLLGWFCDFAALAQEAEAKARDPLETETSPGGSSSAAVDGAEDLSLESLALRGSVLGRAAPEKRVAAAHPSLSEAFAQVFAMLPRWHEWAVSDAAHGGAQDETAPPAPPAAKKRKGAASSARRSDRTGLYQLGSLVQASCALEPVLEQIASSRELRDFLVAVNGIVLRSDHATPRLKAHFLAAVPPILLQAEVRRPSISLQETAAEVERNVKDMVLQFFPLTSHDYARESDEYATYLALLSGLQRAMERSLPSIRLLPALHGTLREEGHREENKVRHFLKRFVLKLAGCGRACQIFNSLFEFFLDEANDDRVTGNVRFAVMEKIALPLLWEFTAAQDACVDLWASQWERLLERANSAKVLGEANYGNEDLLSLKVQSLTCVYGAMEILFVRTHPEVLREQVPLRLPPQEKKPSQALILAAKKVLEKPTFTGIDDKLVRRYHARAYAALSAAICATQTTCALYNSYLFKAEVWNELLCEPWDAKPVQLAALTPDSDCQTCARPGYSFAWDTAATARRASQGDRLGAGDDNALLGANLWGSTVALQSTQGGMGFLVGASSLAGSLQMAAMRRAAGTLSHGPGKQQQALAASIRRATQGVAASLAQGQEAPPIGTLVELDGFALRLHAALSGLEPVQDSGGVGVTWKNEYVENDNHLFPDGPSRDCGFALLLTLLRTADVMVERFGADTPAGLTWATAMLSLAEKDGVNFRLKLLALRLFVLRADLLKSMLYGRDPRLFRFVVDVLLAPDFGAEKRFHYIFRDALQSLLVPKVDEETTEKERSEAPIVVARECAYDAHRLFHRLQVLLPHNKSTWQKLHTALFKLYVTHFFPRLPRNAIEPDRMQLLRQLTATSQAAPFLRHSSLRQFVILLELGNYDPFASSIAVGDVAIPGAAGDASPAALWQKALLGSVASDDVLLAAYASGAVGMLGKWFPLQSAAIVEGCCGQIDASSAKEKQEGQRAALCAEQLLSHCPWALCGETGSQAPRGPSCARRRLFTRLLSRLPHAPPTILRPLIAAFAALCRGATEVAAAAGGASGAAHAALGETVPADWRQPPPRPGGEALKKQLQEQRDEFLLTMRSGSIWRTAFQSTDFSLQIEAARLVRSMARVKEEGTLFECLGLMLEAHAGLKTQRAPKKDIDTFARELQDVCIVVCDRRSDVARGEVLTGVLAFLVQASVSTGDDEDDKLRTQALAFWEASLSGDAEQRLAELCSRIHVVDVESAFVPTCLQLLAALARRSAEYRRNLVRKPLADCAFQKMHVAPSTWVFDPREQTQAPVGSYASAFRPALTLARSGRASQRRSATAASARVFAGGAKPEGSVAATLGRGDIPGELMRAPRPFEAPRGFGDSAAASAAGAASARLDAAPRLLRRSEAGARSFGIANQERQTKAALSNMERSLHTRDNGLPVSLVREYRIGEYPDVEMTAGDVLEPLLKLSLQDSLVAEELMLALWTGIASSKAAALEGGGGGAPEAQPLTLALIGLLERTAGDVPLVHFLHRLLPACGRGAASSLPAPLLQRSLHASLLSGVEALEDLLPSTAQPLGQPPLARTLTGPTVLTVSPSLGRAGGGNGSGSALEPDRGRQRCLLSALHEAYSALGERPSEEAAAGQLKAIGAFVSPHSAAAMERLQEGAVLEAEALLKRVLEDEETALPEWEVQMASAARLNALERLMSWDDLASALQSREGAGAAGAAAASVGAGFDARGLRAQLGRSVMIDIQALSLPDDQQAAVRNGRRAILDSRLQASQRCKMSSARGAALLAVHAASRERWDDARRLILQGYDAFTAAWQEVPLLALRAQHELLSSLPLLQATEAFVEDHGRDSVLQSRSRSLSMAHDNFAAWEDSMLLSLASAEVRRDRQSMAVACAGMAHYCRKLGVLKTAEDLMRRCLTLRERQTPEFVSETIKLKLQQGKPARALFELADKQASEESSGASALAYALLRAKVASTGWKQNVFSHEVASNAYRSALGLAATAGGVADQSRVHAKLAKFADAVLRKAQLQATQGAQGGGVAASLAGPRPPDLDEGARQALALAVVESVTAVLRAGDFGAAGGGHARAFRQAHDRLPRVFELLAEFPQCRELYQQRATGAPPWPLLRWLPQALAHLPDVPALRGPLVALAGRFPQAIFWPLQLCSHPDAVGGRSEAFEPLWAELRRKGSNFPTQLASDFTEALDSLSPHMRFAADVKKFREALVKERWADARLHWRTLWRRFIDLGPEAGRLRSDLARRLQQDLAESRRRHGLAAGGGAELGEKDLAPGRREAWGHLLQAFDRSAKSSAQGGGKKEPLEALSPWLAAFDARRQWLGSEDEWLEIPGQYAGLESPDVKTHARILRFGPQVLVMASKQKPKRLVILGSSEQEHWFLVKGGEDLRLDARVEQLFEVINGSVASSPTLGLCVRTYAVVPVLPDLGMVEWVRPTKTIKQIVLEMHKAKDMIELEAHRLRREWTARVAGVQANGQPLPVGQRYEKIFQLPKAEVEAAFLRSVTALPASATFRAFLARAALSPEALWHMRQRFAASLAAASAATYILGIGDRHLENFLVCTHTMEVVPIDFGYSFGIGALLPVPELAPFRLTGFLASAMQPLAGDQMRGAFHSGLSEVLDRTRSQRELLLDTCAIFLREPLMDWSSEARRRGEAVDFMPRRRLNFVRERLSGRHPAAILAEELQDNQCPWVKTHSRRTHGFQSIVAGTDDPMRADLLERSRSRALTPAEQAECLIRQATDPNVLGRAWEGWAPEI